MSKFFLGIYNFFENKKYFLYFVMILSLATLLFFSSKVKLQENFLQMLPEDKNTEQLKHFLENSKFSDRIIVCVSSKDTSKSAEPEKLVELADTFAEQLKNKFPEYIESINYQAEDNSITTLLSVIDNNLPIFLEDKDYLSIDTLITKEGIHKKIEYNYRTLVGPAGIGLKKFILQDPLGLNFIAYKKLDRFRPDEQLELYEQHFVTKNKYNLLMFITPKYPSKETTKNANFFAKMDELIKDVSTSNKEFNIVYFGAPVVASGNAEQIRKDTILTVSLTIIILVLAMTLFFRKLTAPILILIPVVFGGLFALTFIYFLQGSISVISLGAGSLILGIAINYSLHFLTHYRYHPSVSDVIKDLSFPMTIGSLTTIGGFLCLQYVKAPVLRDLGLFAALSLTGAALTTLIFLPHLINPRKSVLPEIDEIKNPFYNNLLKRLPGNKLLLWFFVILTPIFLYFAFDVKFETDMYKINYMSKQTKNAEAVVNNVSSFYQKSVFQITKGNTLEEALMQNEKSLPLLDSMKAEGKIKSFTNVSILLPSEQEQKRRILKWNTYWSVSKKNEVYTSLIAEGTNVKFKANTFLPFKTVTDKQYSVLSKNNSEILKDAFLKNFIEESNGTYSLIGLIKTTPEYVGDIYKKFAAIPSSIVFDRQYITDKLMGIVSSDFNFITIWTSLLVFVALLLVYGRIELALITFIPMVITWIWILGLMTLIGIKFNIVNIVLSTLIFALGDDFCIFTTDGLQQEYAKKVTKLNSISTSISLSAITTIVGLGVLIFAKHPALNSIALVSIIGIFSVWIISQTLQPVLFKLLISNPTDKKHEPYTFLNIIKSTFAFSYFIFGSILIGILGLIILKLTPGKMTTKKNIYHWGLSNFAKSIIYIMGNVKKQIINDRHEDFSKPAVIIANHSSFLDILVLVMLNPKLILLTNKWVYNSPVLGLAVRLAEYYPVADGAENIIDKLSSKVAEGYSIVVFPEGTRSVDGVIARFHKGAFYLADHLKLDILPILIHGANYTMTKGFFYLKNGTLTLKYLPRIMHEDKSFGNTYSERAKLIGRYFRQEHKFLSNEIETPRYFRGQLFSNYLFKGAVLEWYMKIKVSMEKNYVLLDQTLPKEGKILDIGCGYGFLSYMMGYTSKNREILGIDYDIDKIEVAKNGYLKGQNVQFEQANALEFQFKQYDAIVLFDVLHYLQTKDQIQVLENCIRSIPTTGMIMIRDGIKELEKRHRWTKLSEVFSTQIFGFNKTGNNGLTFLSSKLIYDFASKHNLQLSTIDNSVITSNVIFVLKKK